MIDERMYEAAKIASEICSVPAEWLYAQMAHESTNVIPGHEDHGKPFKSALAVEQHNFGGLTQVEENDTPQPDGRFYYMKFNSPEHYCSYLGRYLKRWFPRAVAAQTIEEYVTLLKDQPDEDDPSSTYSYYGDSIENYLEGTLEAYEEAFGNV